MTNGEKLKEVFPSIELYEKSHDAIQINFNSVWWNAEYQQPSSSEKPNKLENTTSSDDCISRQDVLSEIIRFSTEEGASVECQQLYCDVNNMPSVIPIRPKMRWIDHSDEGYVECPKCGSATNCDDNISDLHFCFSCGVKMDSEVEE